jgi:hypothetical protein
VLIGLLSLALAAAVMEIQALCLAAVVEPVGIKLVLVLL